MITLKGYTGPYFPLITGSITQEIILTFSVSLFSNDTVLYFYSTVMAIIAVFAGLKQSVYVLPSSLMAQFKVIIL